MLALVSVNLRCFHISYQHDLVRFDNISYCWLKNLFFKLLLEKKHTQTIKRVYLLSHKAYLNNVGVIIKVNPCYNTPDV